jgi:DtxR family Mn-dependent transcriptional regulator
MQKGEKISSSLEDYLEAIYEIIEEKQAVRAKDIAERLGVAASSVTIALRGLVKRELINHVPYDVITLTDQGRKLAKEVSRKHGILKSFFMKVLAVEESVADDCACKMEHVVPDEVLNRFVEFVKFEETCDHGGTKWIEGVGFVCHSYEESKLSENCTACVNG